jgi:hypothetical protein
MKTFILFLLIALFSYDNSYGANPSDEATDLKLLKSICQAESQKIKDEVLTETKGKLISQLKALLDLLPRSERIELEKSYHTTNSTYQSAQKDLREQYYAKYKELGGDVASANHDQAKILEIEKQLQKLDQDDRLISNALIRQNVSDNHEIWMKAVGLWQLDFLEPVSISNAEVVYTFPKNIEIDPSLQVRAHEGNITISTNLKRNESYRAMLGYSLGESKVSLYIDRRDANGKIYESDLNRYSLISLPPACDLVMPKPSQWESILSEEVPELLLEDN